jgi:hypothetical protein
MSINISYFAGAGAQFFDDNGSPLVGGLLYVYAAGTTTSVASYTEIGGGTLNSNPIILDAGGRTPNQIWLTGGVLYKFVLKTSAGVTIGTYDNIPAVDDPTTFNNFLSITGTNAIVGTITPAITAYLAGATYSFTVANTNTGAVTIDISGLGAKNILANGGAVLVAGQLIVDSIVSIQYDGVNTFQLMNASGSVPTVTSSTANAAVATTLGSVGPTGSTAGNPQGWMKVNVAGTNRYIPYW